MATVVWERAMVAIVLANQSSSRGPDIVPKNKHSRRTAVGAPSCAADRVASTVAARSPTWLSPWATRRVNRPSVDGYCNGQH